MQTTRQRLSYILSDFLAVNAAWCVFNIIRFCTLPVNSELSSFAEYYSMPIIIIGQIAFPMMMVCLFAVSGYYNSVFFKSRLDDILNAFSVSLIGAIIIFFAALFNDTIPDRLNNLEMTAIVWVLMGGASSIGRLLLTRSSIKKINKGKIYFDAIVIGVPDKALALARDLMGKYKNMGFRVVAFATPGANAVHESSLPTLDMASAPQFPDNINASAYIVIPDGLPIDRILGVINGLMPSGKSIYVTPGAGYLLSPRPRTASVVGEVLVDVSKSNIPEGTRNLKFISDILCAGLALAALSPFFLTVAALIKLDSKGPVFYRQTRIGYKKRPFEIIKFRTMHTQAEPDGPMLTASNDARITKLGRFLRKYRIDELPQFWNVLRGEMSLVGPRPEREFFIKQIVDRAPEYNLVHQVRPGITSWGMVKYGYAQNVDQMLQRMRYDLVYLENISFAVDVKILFYTVSTVLTGKGI